MQRRNLFRAAGLAAGAAFVPAVRAEAPKAAAKAAEKAAENAPKQLKGGTVVSAKLPAAPDLTQTHTFTPGGSTLSEGSVMTATHWGIGTVHVKGGRIERIDPYVGDKAPSLMQQSAAQQPYNRTRIRYPMVRKSYLKKGWKADGDDRGAEPFVRVTWEKAAELIARELERVKEKYGPEAIYAASPAWMSPGSVGNARNVMQRVLNLNGGFTGGTGDYSTGCSQTILPYVIGSNGVYEQMTSWQLIHDKTELILLWGCDPNVTNELDWATTMHEAADEWRRLKTDGRIQLIAVNPVKPDTAEYYGEQCRWIAPRPSTDVAMMLGIASTLEEKGLVDKEFLRKYTVGYDKFRAYLLGETDGVKKTAEWAAGISGVSADVIRKLAEEMAGKRTLIMSGWGIQRAEHGEQVHWMIVVLSAMLGQIGLPGGGFGFSFHYCNAGAATAETPILGGISAFPKGVAAPAHPTVIPVARITDAILNPGKEIDHNGGKIKYPDLRMAVWSGGNPFGHQEDLNAFKKAWRKLETTVVCDVVWTATARHADIVLPACTTFERNDITSIGSYANAGFAAIRQAIQPQYESRSDYEAWREVARAMGKEKEYTEGLDELGWVKRFYNAARMEAAQNGMQMPSFKDFWDAGVVTFPVLEDSERYNYFGEFRKNPIVNPLGTASGKIEIFSEKVASYGYDDCGGHPMWFEPTEWLGGKEGDKSFALITPASRYRLHTQLDSTEGRNFNKIEDREACWLHPNAAEKLGVVSGDVVKLTSRRGETLAGVLVTDRVRPDTIVLHHGSWHDPIEPDEDRSLDVNGCDNVLTIDIPASKLSNGNVANTALVRAEKWTKALPRVTVYEQPAIEPA